MRTTTTDIDDILSGKPMVIEVAYPLDDQSEGFQWYMKQPNDWVLDMANAVYDAAHAQAMAMPEMEAAKNLPPTDEWIAAQKSAVSNTEDRIAELEAMTGRTPEDSLELANLKEHLTLIIRPSGYSRAQQIANMTANKQRQNWLMPRLIVDAEGGLVCNPDTPEGRDRWERLGRSVRTELLIPLAHVLILVNYAKNSKASQSSAQK